MRRPLIDAKGFRSFHWTRGTSSRKGHGGLQKRGLLVYVKKKKKEGRRMSARKIVF
jgi:hypothetical protein